MAHQFDSISLIHTRKFHSPLSCNKDQKFSEILWQKTSVTDIFSTSFWPFARDPPLAEQDFGSCPNCDATTRHRMRQAVLRYLAAGVWTGIVCCSQHCGTCRCRVVERNRSHRCRMMSPALVAGVQAWSRMLSLVRAPIHCREALSCMRDRHFWRYNQGNWTRYISGLGRRVARERTRKHLYLSLYS